MLELYKYPWYRPSWAVAQVQLQLPPASTHPPCMIQPSTSCQDMVAPASPSQVPAVLKQDAARLFMSKPETARKQLISAVSKGSKLLHSRLANGESTRKDDAPSCGRRKQIRARQPRRPVLFPQPRPSPGWQPVATAAVAQQSSPMCSSPQSSRIPLPRP